MRVDSVVEADESHAKILQLAQDCEEVNEASAEPVELGHGDGIHFSLARCCKERVQAGAAALSARVTVVREFRMVPTPSVSVSAEYIELGVERLVGGGDAGVNGDTEG